MLLFDFDGVMMDSLDEITITAYNAATGRLVTAMGEMSAAVSRLFKRNRFHVQSIGDVIPLMDWCLENDRTDADCLLTKAEYQAMVQPESVSLIDRVSRFYETRKRFVEKDSTKWLLLSFPFQPLWNELKKHEPERLIILTNKNKEAAFYLCRHYGLMVSEENIYSGDNGVTKIENLKAIHARFDSAPYDFIDDSLKNLHELDRHFNDIDRFINLILALWGYTGPDDETTARAQGYPAYNQETFIEFFNRSPSCNSAEKAAGN